MAAGRRDATVNVERARAASERLPSRRVAEEIAALFKVLSDPSRCRILAALIDAGEVCVGELSATVAMSESNVSHHLRVLRDQGLVRARRAGRLVIYAPDDAHVRLLLDITREHVAHRERRRDD